MEESVREKLHLLKRGNKIMLYPYSRIDGDYYNSVAFPCPGIGPEIPIELKEPLEAIFQDFNQDMIRVTTDWIECLVLDVGFIKDLKIIQ